MGIGALASPKGFASLARRFSAGHPASLVASEPVALPEALATGTRRALRYWPIVLLIFALNGCGALALTAPVQRALSPLADRPDVWSPDGSFPFTAFTEYGLVQSRSGAPAGAGDPLLAVMLVAALFAAVTAAAVPALVLQGGILLLYHEEPAEQAWRRFAWGAWHWLAPFFALWLVESAVAFVAWLVALAMLSLGGALGAGAAAGVAGLALVLAVTTAAGALGEYARIAGVAHGRRNPFALIGLGLRAIAARPVVLLGLYLLGPALALAIAGGYVLLIGPFAVNAPLPLMVAVQQGVVLARLGARQWRLAGEVVLVDGRS